MAESNMTSMIVVSNRLPFVLKRDKNGSLLRHPSAGGLVTALSPVVKEKNGLWIGWPGINLQEDDVIPNGDPNTESPAETIDPEQLRAVNINSCLFDEYYNGSCNAAIWPLFHSMPDRAVFKRDAWKAYERVNARFAEEVFEALKGAGDMRLLETPPFGPLESPSDDNNNQHAETPLIWIHDYQLLLVGNYVRKMMIVEGKSCKIAFFLHIPFPTWDIFRLFPWFDDVLVGLLDCDLIGFHIDTYVDNFLECCVKGIGCRVDHEEKVIHFEGRIIHVQSFPIGIPFERFENMAKVVKNEIIPHPDCKMILGVDRLDYTKGIIHRVKAFEKLLDSYPCYKGKVMLLQVAVPSRSDVQEYIELKDELDREVGRINGRFSTSSWSPFRYIYQCLKQEQLCAFYRDADVALVTPIRDGMNLVAKEFVACQIEEPGVLILSPFTGAGETMHEALICNPLEEYGLADTMHRALSMPTEERELRMSALRRRERTNDVHHWVNSFLKATRDLPGDDDRTQAEPITINQIDKWLANYVGSNMKLALLLDYDGTLAPIASHPDVAHLPIETKRVLETLVSIPGVYVAVVSGRNVNNLRTMIGINQITYAGNHGADIIHPNGDVFTHPDQIKYTPLIEDLRVELESTCMSVEGAWIESKGSALTVHYRNAATEERPALIEQVTATIIKHNFKPMKAHCAVEARPPIQWDKGRACIYLLRTVFGIDWSEHVRVIYAGDDTTDEDAMIALAGMAATFRVTNSRTVKTSAKYRLQDTRSVLTLLKWVQRHFQIKVAGKYCNGDGC